MSTIGQEIIAGLTEAVGYMDGTADRAQFCAHDLAPARAPDHVDVKAIRQKLGLSQSVFAAAFGLSLHALRNWEQGKRQPDPAARAYLRVIEAAPDVVRRALCGA
ncbi:helix-turn-helix domain-containing protein [uncultured Desulfovibrio sp.]|uniref:helix-turn-helix domain-containing protein n=1 Tax=uncultured Desulfovibrio sp. TaxID=167968 RepID=UPI00262B11FC|nr:helix-turn-helix domain-containing protein [uncultured Desulfovibrio sp.]